LNRRDVFNDWNDLNDSILSIKDLVTIPAQVGGTLGPIMSWFAETIIRPVEIPAVKACESKIRLTVVRSSMSCLVVLTF
jgi:hypothetical protein